MQQQDLTQESNIYTREHFIISICEAKEWLEERGDTISIKNCLSTCQVKENYQAVSKLYLAEEEMDRLFNDDRQRIIWSE